MMEYADTGFLCSLYAPDAHTAKAAAAMRRMKSELAFVFGKLAKAAGMKVRG